MASSSACGPSTLTRLLYELTVNRGPDLLTHLVGELSVEREAAEDRAREGGDPGEVPFFVPLHVLLDHESLTYEEFSELHDVYARVCGQPGDDGDWRWVYPLRRLDREFTVRGLFRADPWRRRRAPGDQKDVGPENRRVDGGERHCRYGLLLSVPLDLRRRCPRGTVGGAEAPRFLRLRFRSRTRREAPPLDVDFSVPLLLRGGMDFYAEHRPVPGTGVEGRERDAVARAGAGAGRQAPAEELRVEQLLSSDAVVPLDGGFFDLGGHRRISADQAADLARFQRAVGDAREMGPLEAPSRIRGLERRDPRGGFRDIAPPGEDTSVPPLGRVDRWLADDNAVRVVRVRDVTGRRVLLAVWYAEGLAGGLDLRAVVGAEDGGAASDAAAAALSLRRLGRVDSAVSGLVRAVERSLVVAARRADGVLPQLLAVALPDDESSAAGLGTLLWLSRDVWVVGAGLYGCIIKALTAPAPAVSASDAADAEGDQLRERPAWADLVWLGRSRVTPARPALLAPAPGLAGAGLWRVLDPADRRPLGWEIEPGLCVVYAWRESHIPDAARAVTVLWTLPGGFALTLRPHFDRRDVAVVRQKLGGPRPFS